MQTWQKSMAEATDKNVTQAYLALTATATMCMYLLAALTRNGLIAHHHHAIRAILDFGINVAVLVAFYTIRRYSGGSATALITGHVALSLIFYMAYRWTASMKPRSKGLGKYFVDIARKEQTALLSASVNVGFVAIMEMVWTMSGFAL